MIRESFLQQFGIAIVVVLAIIGFMNIAPSGIASIESFFSTATVDNSGLPNLEEVQSVVGNISDIKPVYQTEFGGNVTGWKVVFIGNFSGEGTVKTRKELLGLAANINKAKAWPGKGYLSAQGCEQITLKPFTSEVYAKVGNSTAIGNLDTNWFRLVGKMSSKIESWDIMAHKEGDVEILQKISNNISLYKMYSWTVPEYPNAAPGSFDSIMYENGAYYWLKYDTSISGVSKKNIEELNKFLKQHNVTALSF